MPPLTRKPTALRTRVPVAVIACLASLGITFVDVSVEAVGINCLITAELALDVVAIAGGRSAVLLFADLLGFFLPGNYNQVECTYS